jgi:hypothetical protein
MHSHSIQCTCNYRDINRVMLTTQMDIHAAWIGCHPYCVVIQVSDFSDGDNPLHQIVAREKYKKKKEKEKTYRYYDTHTIFLGSLKEI